MKIFYLRLMALITVTFMVISTCGACRSDKDIDNNSSQNFSSVSSENNSVQESGTDNTSGIDKGNNNSSAQSSDKVSGNNSQKPSLPTSSNNNSNGNNNTSSSATQSQITITDEARPLYKPTSLTMGFYDTSSKTYGFTWNTEVPPKESVLQVCEGATFSESRCKEYPAKYKIEYSYVNGNAITYFYVNKVEVQLKENTIYTYRAYDKVAKIGTEPAKIKTVDFSDTSFTFTHVGESQVAGDSSDTSYTGEGTGKHFYDTLAGITSTTPNLDFLLHSGDLVEYSKYESYWENMLDYNFKYLSTVPMMAIAGNHETTYRCGSYEMDKHFNVKIPTQNTEYGYYYYFDYGNVRFIMLNTNRLNNYKLTSDQYNWLENTLKNNTKKWTIVSMHHPMYSIGTYGSNPEKNSIAVGLKEQLTKLFAENNVDLVLQGHDHTYSKTYPIAADGKADTNPTYETVNSVKYTVNPKGVIYSMHGPAGNQTRSPYGTPDSGIYELYGASKTNSWATITVEDNRLTVKVMYYNGGSPEVWQTYGIVKK